MATDYDEVRSDVRECLESSLKALKTASAPGALSVVLELDQADGLDQEGPGGAFIAEELVVQVVPQARTSSRAFRVSLSGTVPRLPGRRMATRTAWNAKGDP